MVPRKAPPGSNEAKNEPRFALRFISTPEEREPWLWAFALASFMTGVAGCLLAAQVGVSRPINFQTQDSLTLAATALIGGIFSLWGAVVAGVFGQLLPFLLSSGQLWGWVVSQNFLLIIFGIGLLQVLLTAPGGIVEQLPKDIANLGRLVVRRIRKLTVGKAGAS